MFHLVIIDICDREFYAIYRIFLLAFDVAVVFGLESLPFLNPYLVRKTHSERTLEALHPTLGYKGMQNHRSTSRSLDRKSFHLSTQCLRPSKTGNNAHE